MIYARPGHLRALFWKVASMHDSSRDLVFHLRSSGYLEHIRPLFQRLHSRMAFHYHRRPCLDASGPRPSRLLLVSSIRALLRSCVDARFLESIPTMSTTTLILTRHCFRSSRASQSSVGELRSSTMFSRDLVSYLYQHDWDPRPKKGPHISSILDIS